MKAENQTSTGTTTPKTRKKTKIIKWVIIAATAVIIAGLFAVPAWLSSKSGEAFLLGKINNAIPGKVNFSAFSMSWFKGVKVTDFTYEEGAGKTSVAVKTIQTNPKYLSLIFGAPAFGKTVIDRPEVKIKLPAEPDPTGPSAPPASIPARKAPVLPVKRIDLTIKNGNIQIEQPTGANSDSKLEMAEINTTLDLRPPGRRTKFSTDLNVTTGETVSPVKADAELTTSAKNPWRLGTTSGTFAVETDKLELGTLAPFFAAAGLNIDAQGVLTTKANVTLDKGQITKIDAAVSGEKIRVKPALLKSDTIAADKLDGQIKLQAAGEFVNIEKLDLATDWLQLRAAGSVPRRPEALQDLLNPDASQQLTANLQCDVAAVCQMLPNTLGLKEGTVVKTGRLTANAQTATQQQRRVLTAELKLEDLTGNVGDRKLQLQPVTAGAELVGAAPVARIERLNITTAFCKVNCTGPMDALEYSADLDLARLQSELGQILRMGDYTTRGTVSGKGSVAFAEDEITSSGSTTVTELQVTSPKGAKAGQSSIGLDHDFAYTSPESLLNINSVELTGDFGSISLKDAVLSAGDKTDKAINLPVAAEVELASIRPFAVMFASLPPELGLFGKVSAPQLAIRGKDDTLRLACQNAEITDFKVTYPDKEPFEQSHVAADFEILYNAAERSWAVEYLNLTSPQIKIRRVTVEQSRDEDTVTIRGRAEADYDLQAVSNLAAGFMPEGLTLKGERKQQITFDSTYPIEKSGELLANMNAKTTLGFDSAAYQGLQIGAVETNLTIDAGRLQISPFTTTINKGSLSFAAGADFTKKPSLLTNTEPLQIKDARIDDVATEQLLKYLSPVFIDATGVTGVADFSCETLAIPLAGGGKKDIQLAGTVGIRNLQLGPGSWFLAALPMLDLSGARVDMQIRPTKFTVKNGTVAYDDMQLDVGDNPVNFAGAIGLDNSLDMSVTLPYTLGGRTIRTDTQTGADRVTLPLGGTIDNPQLKVDKLLEQTIEKEIDRQIQKELEKRGLKGLGDLLK